MVAPALKYESNWTESYIFVNHLSRPFIWESLRNLIFSGPNGHSWKLQRAPVKSLSNSNLIPWSNSQRYKNSKLSPAADFNCFATLGTLNKSLRLALIWLPEVNFPQNETLRMYVGCIQPQREIWLRESGCFAVVATTSGLFRFSDPFQRTSRHFKNSIGYHIL